MFILPIWHFQIGQLASYISSKLETNSAKFCLTILGWSTDTVYLPMKNAAFCVRNVDFYWCNPCVYELAFISLWCSQNCSFSSFTFLWYSLSFWSLYGLSLTITPTLGGLPVPLHFQYFVISQKKKFPSSSLISVSAKPLYILLNSGKSLCFQQAIVIF